MDKSRLVHTIVQIKSAFVKKPKTLAPMEAASFFAYRKFLLIKVISKQKRYSGQRETAPKKNKKIL
jgi:hypothetical protein